MLVASPKYHRPLSSNQVHVLKLLYKFRFVSTDLLAEYLGKDRSTVYESFYVLGRQGYVAKQYDKTYRIVGRPATYCLTAKAIGLLRRDGSLSEKSLHNMYKNKTMATNAPYIAHCLGIMETYNALNRLYPNSFHIFTKFELSDYDHFPRPLPDLYLRRKKARNNTVHEYMLDIFHENTPFFVRRKRLKVYMEHIESGEWEEKTETAYPSLLFVAPNNKVQARVLKEAEYNYERYGIDEDEIGIFITTRDELTDQNDTSEVWHKVLEEDDEEVKLFSL